jgi:four helix bundle protein
MVKSYRDLKVWQKAMDIAEAVHVHTIEFPKQEIYGLTSQLRRAAVSVPSNIAEGHNRDSTKEFLRFLAIAQGSLAELETQLMLASRFQYLSSDILASLLAQADEVGKMLRGLQHSLSESSVTLLAPRS